MVCTVPTEKSGIPIVAFNLMEALLGNSSKDNLRLGYVSINEPPEYFKSKLKDWDIPSYYIPRKISNPIGYIRHLSEIAKNYEVMHVHGNSATLVLEMIAAKLAGVKVRIAHSHNTTCSAKIIDKLARPLFYSLCNLRLACGIEAGKWLFHKRDFKVINNGIVSEKFKFDKELRKTLRNKLGITKEKVIGHIGNFNYQKNHDFLIKVFFEIHQCMPESKLLLLGDGPLREEIEEEVVRQGLSKAVIFAGSVNNPQDYMNVMDMVIMPSHFEGLPLTMVEEQANGLPILAADSITQDANLTGKVIFLSLNESISKWTTETIRILENENRCDVISNSNIQKIKESGFDIGSVARDLKNVYITQLNTV